MAWAPVYATVGELRSLIKVGDLSDDLEMADALESASRVIDRTAQRQFGQVASAEPRTYGGGWSRVRGAYKVEIDDVQDLTGFVVTISGATVAASNYQLLPFNAAEEGRPYETILVESLTTPTVGTGPSTVDITGLWGWTAVPQAIKQACLLQAHRFLRRRDAPFGIAGSPDTGSEMRLLERMDPDVAVTVKRYRRNHPLVG